MEPYSHETHRHRFAAWAAARAASSSKSCRFAVQLGVALVEHTSLRALAAGWDQLPEAAAFDGAHRAWRQEIVEAAPGLPGWTRPEGAAGRAMTHGVAAKLINVYLKTLFACSVDADPAGLDALRRAKLAAIHPPIDRLLLDALAKKNFEERRRSWRRFRDRGWSAFSSEDYEAVIALIREVTAHDNEGGEPGGGGLWKIERYWPGYQGSQAE